MIFEKSRLHSQRQVLSNSSCVVGKRETDICVFDDFRIASHAGAVFAIAIPRLRNGQSSLVSV